MTHHQPGAQRSQEPAGVGMDTYAGAVSRVCPYLVPSIRTGQTWWTRHAMESGDSPEAVEAALFAGGVWAAQQVRHRAARGEQLSCEVLVVDWPGNHAQVRTVMDWPHWALKHLLAPVGIMCGKFPTVGHECSDGRLVAAPPALTLVLRRAVPARDSALLAGTPEVARTLVAARDDGRPLLAAVPGVDPHKDPASAWTAVRAWAALLPRHTARKEYGG